MLATVSQDKHLAPMLARPNDAQHNCVVALRLLAQDGNHLCETNRALAANLVLDLSHLRTVLLVVYEPLDKDSLEDALRPKDDVTEMPEEHGCQAVSALRRRRQANSVERREHGSSTPKRARTHAMTLVNDEHRGLLEESPRVRTLRGHETLDHHEDNVAILVDTLLAL